MDIINFKKANCKNCFKCLRECPVKAIAFKDGQAGILTENCLICGHCLTVCPQNAKQVRSELDEVRALIQSGRKVVASVAPSFIAAFGCGMEALDRSLGKLGFAAARETAEGAAVVAAGYERLLKKHKTPVLLSSACPTVVRLIEKYYPESIGCLADIDSPMTAHAKMIKKSLSGAAVVFIGPCISKKDEAGWEEDAVDHVLTFDELLGWMDREHVLPENPDGGPIQPSIGRTARSFPVEGGILASMPRRLPDIDYLSVSGIAKCREVLEELRKGSLHGCFIELSACEDSCIGGPCMIRPLGGRVECVRRVADFAKKATKASPLLPEGIDFSRQFRPQPVVDPRPGERAIREILEKTGKKRPEDELNCGACGYSTCREKAVAVYQGKAVLEMCMPYMRERAEFISDNVIAFTPNAIVVLDDFLNIQAINQAAANMFDLHGPGRFKGKYVGELTDSALFEEALVRKQNILDKKVYLYKNDKYVEHSVIYVQQHHLIFGTFKDLTDSHRQSEKLNKVKLDTVETADKVIEKQMRIAQEIAMLLGESTAETKIALTRLKQTMLAKED